jgi:hypothetical protein
MRVFLWDPIRGYLPETSLQNHQDHELSFNNTKVILFSREKGVFLWIFRNKEGFVS